MASGIYSITAPSGKRYIGSAKDIKRRWLAHLSALRGHRHQNGALQRAADKYGVEALVFEVLEHCAPDVLFKREQFFMDTHARAHLYNIAPIAGGGSGPMGAVSRAKIAKARLGMVFTEETRAKMAAAQRVRAPADDTTRAKRAAANRGRTRSPETRAKMAAAVRSAETRAKMSASRKAVAARKRRESGGVLGVYPTRNGKWRALVRDRGEYRHIGTYDTQELARTMRFVYLEAWPYREMING